MEKCTCFQCGRDFGSQNSDDIAGDGRCEGCTEKAKRIAFKVDIEMAQKRKFQTPTKSRIRELFTEEQILKGDVAGSPKINIRDLGITLGN